MTTNSLKQWFLQGGDDGTPRRATVGGWPRILLLDGGVSTHLEHNLSSSSSSSSSRNEKSAAFPYRELWSSGLLLSETGRQQIRKGHLDWLEAGANAIETVTYQCHYESHLWPKRSGGESSSASSDIITDAIMDQMWKDGIDLARQTVREFNSRNHHGTPPRPRFVIASSGCYGAALSNGAEYTGDYNCLLDDEYEKEDRAARPVDKLVEFHRRKLQTALALHPDCIAIETVPSLTECRALRKLLQDPRMTMGDDDDNIACYISLACRNGTELNDGSLLQDALSMLRPIPTSRLQAIGLNCCDSQHLPNLLDILLRDMLATTRKADGSDAASKKRGIVIYPNSGESWDAVSETWVGGTGVTESDAMAQRLYSILQHIERTWQRYSSSSSSCCCNDPPTAAKTRTRPSLPSILIGGCCRTTPAAIQALAQRVDANLASEEEGCES